MPITPEQAHKDRNAAATPAAIALSTRIDTWLSSPRSTIGNEWFFDIRGHAADVIEEVIKLYEAAGWNVRRSYDRDGSSLVFSERKS